MFLGDSIQWGQERPLFQHNALSIPTTGPFWLSREENRIDVLVGNPPWLSFRFMTAEMQQEFRRLSEIRGLWSGASVATNQDLSGLFILRAAERYLRPGGRFAFVMPWSALRGRQWAGLRAGRHPLGEDATFGVAYAPAWDLHAVKPPFFPVPACVLFGTRTVNAPSALPTSVVAWRGKLPAPNMRWAQASEHLEREDATVTEATDPPKEARSPYAEIFFQGATVVPKVLFVVEEKKAKKGIGLGVGRVAVASLRSANEKAPWKALPSLAGAVEKQFVHALHSGPTILPYRTLKPHHAVIPWDLRRKCLMDGDDPEFLRYPATRDWFRAAEKLWNKHRTSANLSLRERLDYHKGLSTQFPKLTPRVVYNASGMYLAAAVVEEPSLYEHTLYWGTPLTIEEGHYLAAVLNSDVLTKRLRPLQARGEHNPRHYDKYVWNVPIPRFDAAVALHTELAALGLKARGVAKAVKLPERARFEAMRAAIRRAVSESGAGRDIERAVAELLPTSA